MMCLFAGVGELFSYLSIGNRIAVLVLLIERTSKAPLVGRLLQVDVNPAS